MNEKNHELVGRAMNTILREILAAYIARELSAAYKNDWWRLGVLNHLVESKKGNLPASGDYATLTDAMDIQLCLLLLDIHWRDIFSKKLSINHYSWAKELNTVRNQWAHTDWKYFDDSHTVRALDTMARLCEQLDDENASVLRDMWREKVYGDISGSMSAQVVSTATPTQKAAAGILQKIDGNLKSWREVMSPHPDVAGGRYREAEFAADLAQVARGEGSVEYLDPVEFFSRTYVTEGMNGLLQQALQRLTSGSGEPVIQLKTSFGGGKTHSMLALYHLLRGKFNLNQVESVKKILQEAGLDALPKNIRLAVVVGTTLNPTKAKRPPNMPGITINTLWGEIGAQLAHAAGDMKLYDEYIKDADKKGVSPGSEALKNLFDACGACLILIDELVAYGKKIYGIEGLPAGSFDNLITFVQELTEAARASRCSMIVASLPESEIEVGGTAGKEILEQVEHTFGRMESIWKPVAANESFEVVRRRLFLPCRNEEEREKICAAFSEMYRTHSAGDFPAETKDLSYKTEMSSCYPIHPEFFHYLYDIWATIEHFQKTRGVLRLMAGVIYYLWINNDASPMIMPGSIPLYISKIRDELSRYLPENWNAIVDSEIDGKDSEPFKIDRENTRFGKNLAARRVARTIFLGSAPSVRGQTIRGVDESHIRLGVIQPHENIADFNDALSKLKSQLSYLYSNETGTRFWYDNRPTLRKLVLDLEQRISDDKVAEEIEKNLHKWGRQSYFNGVHICPTSLDVPDEQNVRLVILPFEMTHDRDRTTSPAIDCANEIIEKSGNNARQHRNMLLFLAADKLRLIDLKKIVRRFKAWQIIRDEAEQRNLDIVQIREANNSISQVEKAMQTNLSMTYCWIFSPYSHKTGDIKTIFWDIAEISCKDEENIQKAFERFSRDEGMLNRWSVVSLKMELDDLLWKNRDCVEVQQLWGYLTDYCYLPRLKNVNVLLETLRQGAESGDYFALADGYDAEKNRYLGLKLKQPLSSTPLMTDLLVKVEVAEEQLKREQPEKFSTKKPESEPETDSKVTEIDLPPEPVEPKKFLMDVELNNLRVHKEIDTYIQEVLSHLTKLSGAKMSMHLDVEVTIPDGVPAKIENIVTENCNTLKLNFHFED